MELEVVPLNIEEQGEKLYLIYRPLLHLAFVGNQAMAELARLVSEDVMKFADQVQMESIAFLADSGFFIPDPAPPAENLPPSTVVLLMTNRCQLRCVYCYAAAGEYSPRKLEITTGKAAIDYAYEQARQKNDPYFQVDFHGGGEPTLEWQTLQELTEYSRRQPWPSKISITTNAIWSKAHCEWLAQHMDTISVSMDGSLATQDHQRPFVMGQPSSAVVMRNLRMLDERQVRYGIRMTACQPWEQLMDNVRFILENTSCRDLQVEPAFNTQRGEHGQPDEEQGQSFVQAFTDAFHLALAYQTDLCYSGARPHIVSRVFCSAPFHALIVNPDDEIVACYEIVSNRHPFAGIATFGRIVDGKVEMDRVKRQHLLDLLGERLETCRTCFCYWHCAGDCFTRSFGLGEKAHLAKSRRCDLNREITLNMLLSLIEKQGGVWHEQIDMNEEKYG
jgi:uncharacterized protein